MNLLMKRFGANITLPVMVILWGIVCTCQGNFFPRCRRFRRSIYIIGAVHSYHSLLVCRFFLGVFEGMNLLAWGLHST
jgi:hypothetical protein